ncbi:hypothetical protein TNCV_643401 [Trichonephila clavipes]|nr:hypothetical protein TNCV_643401 [Trichonephila clavipes]
MVSAYNKKRCAALPFETGIHFRRKTDFFLEEDTNMSYSGFEPEPTRLQAEGHNHHSGWATCTNKNDNLRNPLKTPLAENAISATKLFAFPAKRLIVKPVLPYILEEWS